MKQFVYIADSAYEALICKLNTLGEVVLIEPSLTLYDGIRNHADLHLHRFDQEVYISEHLLHKSPLIINQFNTYVVRSSCHLGFIYPETCLLNAVSTDNVFIHNTKFTHPELLDAAKRSQRQIVNVTQGYVRCTTLPLDDSTFITSDRGIHKALQADYDSTLIRQGFILLDSHEYGFLGGTAGRIGDTVYFNGDVTRHPDYQVIKGKCDELALEIWYVEGEPLRDIGSILSVEVG